MTPYKPTRLSKPPDAQLPPDAQTPIVTWDSLFTEYDQGPGGLALHAVEAYAAILTTALAGGALHVANLVILAFSLTWEIGMSAITRPGWPGHGLTGKTWKASVLGMAAFWIGAGAGDLVVVSLERHKPHPQPQIIEQPLQPSPFAAPGSKPRRRTIDITDAGAGDAEISAACVYSTPKEPCR